MIYATIFMLVFLLTILPLRIRITSQLNFSKVNADFKIKFLFLWIMREHVEVDGLTLQFSGTIDAELQPTSFSSDGKSIVGCITADSLSCVINTPLVGNAMPKVIAAEFVSMVAALVATQSTHCKCKFATSHSNTDLVVALEAAISTTLLEVGVALVKQKLSAMKQRKRSQA